MNRTYIGRILVPVDLSADAVEVVRYAVARARESNAELLLLHVLPFDSAAHNADVVRAQLGTLTQGIAGTDVATRVVVSSGEPAREIIREVDELDADLVVLATHNRVGLLRLLRPSVALRVARAAHCPVLLVHPYADHILETLP